jgi:hypothetical protein
MSVQSDIKTALNAVASGRVYPQVAPAEVDRPFVVYRKVDEDPVMTLQGYTGLTNFTFAFDCWADTYLEALTLADSVRAAVEAAAALKPLSRVPSGADDYEPAVDEFIETVVYSLWHS